MPKETESTGINSVPPPNGADTDIVNIDEVRARLEGEWVLMRVTRFAAYGRPLEGTIVSHSRDREEVSQAIPPRPTPPAPADGPYYLFRAEPRIRSGPALARAAQELIDQFHAQREARRRGMA